MNDVMMHSAKRLVTVNSFDLIIHNRVLWTAAAAWVSAQILKLVINLLVNRRLDLERLLGDGGMPSSHSATVTALAVATGIASGFDSPLFGVSVILAFIVMHDAMGVRLETGKQAKVINDMLEFFQTLDGHNLSPEDTLKELVGHTPLQVFAGLCLGIIVALIIMR